jgi:acyl carrier protein
MPEDPILERVSEILAEIAGPTRTPADAGADTPLGEGGFWLDSLDLFEAILACEQAFGTPIDAGSDVSPDALRTVGSLANLIRATKGAGARSQPPPPGSPLDRARS